MKKQAKIFNGLTGGFIEETYDLPKLGEVKQFTHDNGRSVKISYWKKSEVTASFFEREQGKTELIQTYRTLTEAACAILAWNVAYRIY